MWHLPISPRKLWNPGTSTLLTKRPLGQIYTKSSKTFEYTYRWWSIHIYIYSHDNLLNAFSIAEWSWKTSTTHHGHGRNLPVLYPSLHQPHAGQARAPETLTMESSWFWNIKGLQVGLGIYDDDDDDDDGDDDNLCFSSQRQCCTAFLGLHTGSFISEIVEDVWSLTVKGIDKLERKQLLSVSCELVWQNGLGCKNGKRLSWIHPTKRKDLNRNFRNGPTSLLDKDSTSWNNIQ